MLFGSGQDQRRNRPQDTSESTNSRGGLTKVIKCLDDFTALLPEGAFVKAMFSEAVHVTCRSSGRSLKEFSLQYIDRIMLMNAASDHWSGAFKACSCSRSDKFRVLKLRIRGRGIVSSPDWSRVVREQG